MKSSFSHHLSISIFSPTSQKYSPAAAHVSKAIGHSAAAFGDVSALKELAVDNKRALHAKDTNGWQPLHEAVRGGHLEAVDFLVKNGANIDAVTNDGSGSSPYNIALNSLHKDHPVAKYLSDLGAKNVGPEL